MKQAVSFFPGACNFRIHPRRQLFAPFRPAIRLFAQISAIALRVPTVALAMCGATTTLGSFSSGSSWHGGSGSVTSSPAAKIVPGLQRLGQRLLVHQRAAGRVDEHGRPLHLLELLGAEHAARLLVQVGVDRDEVRLAQQRVEIDLAGAELFSAFSLR